MAVPRGFQLSIAVTLLCGLLALTWISKSFPRSRVSMLSVSGVEKVQKLERELSNKLADEELAKWDKLEAKVLPSAASKVTQAQYAVKETNKGDHISAIQPKAQAAEFFKPGSGAHSTDVRFKHPDSVTPIIPTNAHASSQSVLLTRKFQQKALEPEGPSPSLGDDVIDMPVHGGEDEGDIHVTGDSVNRYMFAKGKHSKTTAPLNDAKHVRFQQKALEPEGPSPSLGDDVIDMPVHGGEDEGDIHVTGDSVNRYMFAKGKHSKTTAPHLAAKHVREAPGKKQKLGFIGEGPWAHVKEGDAHHPEGGGGDFFGRGSVLKKDGGKDGQGGIIVDRWMWTPDAQDHVTNHRRPPCSAACEKPEGCTGHSALTQGDCDETILRDQDLDRDPTKTAPSTYDAYSGNVHGLFKSRKTQNLHSRPVHTSQVQAAQVAGLSSLDKPRALANRLPGLGIFAPTVQRKQLAVFQQLSTVDKHRKPTQAEAHDREEMDGFSLHPSVVKALDESQGKPLGDEIVDGAQDVSYNPDQVDPFMYKDNAAHRSILHIASAFQRPSSPLGDEVLDGLHDDTQVMMSHAKMHAIGKSRKLTAKVLSAANPHALFVAAATRRPVSEIAEPSSDGLRDEVVPHEEVAKTARSRETWETYFSAKTSANAPRAARATGQQLRSMQRQQQLMTFGEHKAAIQEGHNASETSSTTKVKCLDENGTLCGDETVDWLGSEAVHVARDQVNQDPKEVNIYSVFDFSDSPAPEPQFKDHSGLHHGLTDLAARQDMDKIFDSLPGGLPRTT